jgi:GDPmannose 4,6-dehydratase
MCENNPIDSIIINGISTLYLCDIILNNKLNCKLFNASSSEIYKDHLTYNIDNNDTHFKPNSIYGISKTFGHQIINYYRNKYNIHASNGIIFTTESPFRKNIFLLKKIKEHAKIWSSTNEILNIGGLDSFRNIIHASDVANAIKCIITQSNGDSYVICNKDMIKIEDIVIKTYKIYNIELEKIDNVYIDKNSRKPVLIISKPFRDTTKINGNPNKLLDLGWKSKYSIDDIINEI